MSEYLSNINFNYNLNESLKINNSLILNINNISIELFKNDIEKNKIKNLINEVRAISIQIFEDLKSQCKDDHVTIFFSELNNEIIKYLSNLENYLLSRKTNSENSKLNENGFYFGQLNKDTVNDILDVSEKKIIGFKQKAENNQTSRESLSTNTGKDIRKITELLNKDFESQGVLNDVSKYIKKNYFVSGVALELSVPKSTWWKKKEDTKKIPKTLYAHVDESLIYPKSICYLSDVKEDNGPTSIYPSIYPELKLNFLQDIVGRVIDHVGSKSESKLRNIYNYNVEQKFQCEVFKSHFYKLPSSLRFYSHFGWYVEPESKLENIMVKNEIKMMGNKGKYIVFDGAKLLHRGGLIENENRIALQIVFGPKLNIFKRVLNKIKIKN